MRKILRFAAVAATAGLVALGSAASASASVRPPRHCTTQLVTFNFRHGSAVLTETQGPWLHVNEVATYQGDTYTVTSVTHTGFLGHDRFTVSNSYGHPVTNRGPSIWHGEAHVQVCAK